MAQQGEKNANPYTNSADVPKGKGKGGKSNGKEKGKETPKGCDAQGAGESPGKAKDAPSKGGGKGKTVVCDFFMKAAFSNQGDACDKCHQRIPGEAPAGEAWSTPMSCSRRFGTGSQHHP
eukprot:4633283-Amphidinium_carterae.1